MRRTASCVALHPVSHCILCGLSRIVGGQHLDTALQPKTPFYRFRVRRQPTKSIDAHHYVYCDWTVISDRHIDGYIQHAEVSGPRVVVVDMLRTMNSYWRLGL
jgi:hypothetical protein